MLVTAVLGEVCATSDVPAGVVNLLTGRHDELVPVIASHRDIDAVHAADLSAENATALRAGAAENLKRVTVRSAVDWYNTDECHSPSWIERLVEMKTIWHPSAT
jgi:acyl-CoA reductase-like NAD-dependent aldehyde dehydrogenase